MKAVENHSVHPLGVILHLQRGAVESIAQEFDDNVRARKSAVDPDQPLLALAHTA